MTQPDFAVENQSPQDLKQEALLIRERLREARKSERETGFPSGRRWLFGFCIFGILGIALVLLGSDEFRRRAVDPVAGILASRSSPENQVFELPPPPPVATETKTGSAIQFQGGTISFSDEGFQGVLYADTDPTLESSDSESSKDQGFVPPPKSPESEKAFALLQEKSPVAAQIVSGEKEGYTFKEWAPVKADPPVFFIDLVVNRTETGKDLHLVWEIKMDAESVTPMSQAARDLAK